MAASAGSGACIDIIEYIIYAWQAIQKEWKRIGDLMDIAMEQEQKLDDRESWIDWNKKRGFALLEISKEISISQFNAILGYSKIAIRGVFILNGAAGIAILYNIRQLPQEIHTSLCMCGVGAILAVLCSGFTYVTQYLYGKTDAYNINVQLSRLMTFIETTIVSGARDIPQPKFKKPFLGYVFHFCAVAAWAASLSLFCIAAYRAYPLILSLSVES